MSVPTTHLATLLMESHGLAPNVRSTSFASIKVWSKLYQAGSYFVDLSLHPDDEGLKLRGEILTESDLPELFDGIVTLLDQRGSVVATAAIGGRDSGETDFAFEIDRADDYRLEIALDSDTLSVSSLDVS